MEKIRKFLGFVHKFTDQVDRRVLQGETIEHSEKTFSVFEEHTRWISKGKAGRVVELGVPLAIVEDQHQFVLDYQIMWQGGDVDVAVPLVESCQEMHPDLRECSFDRGFHSPANRKRLDELLDTATLPKKGRLNAADQERESDEVFARARKQHSGSTIWNTTDLTESGRKEPRGSRRAGHTCCQPAAPRPDGTKIGENAS